MGHGFGRRHELRHGHELRRGCEEKWTQYQGLLKLTNP